MQQAPNTALVLAAGLGTRLRPLTNDRPKALVEVAGKALIDHMIDALKAVGVQRFVVNVHYFADMLEGHLRARKDIELIISDERDQLRETGGGLKHARSIITENDPIFIANIDSVWLEDKPQSALAIDKLVQAFDPSQMDVCLLLAAMTRSHGFDGAGDFFIEDNNRLRFRGDASAAPYNYMGVHITRPDLVDHIREDAFSLSPVWRDLATKGRLYGTMADVEWMHVGDPEAKAYADKCFSERS